FGLTKAHDDRGSELAEVSLVGTSGRHTWLIGGAWRRDALRVRDLGDLDYTYRAPGVFVQDEYAASGALSLAASARADFHSVHGTFFDPRLSMLVRAGGGFTLRLSAGTGYAAPVPFTDRAEEVGFTGL